MVFASLNSIPNWTWVVYELPPPSNINRVSAIEQIWKANQFRNSDFEFIRSFYGIRIIKYYKAFTIDSINKAIHRLPVSLNFLLRCVLLKLTNI